MIPCVHCGSVGQESQIFREDLLTSASYVPPFSPPTAIQQRTTTRLIDFKFSQGQYVGDLTTGIGAGSDSFYEYLLKSYILFGDPEYLDMFNKVRDFCHPLLPLIHTNTLSHTSSPLLVLRCNQKVYETG